MGGNNNDDGSIRTTFNRRQLLSASGGSLMATVLASAWPVTARSQDAPVIRWGIVGTGSIANSMAEVIAGVPSGELAGVSSRRMASAEAFAGRHAIGRAFDSWEEMSAWDGVDAIYVATPTGVREEISVAAANHGKHVLAEKPFASLASVQRIAAACRDNNVGFMDGTHFGHHPRTSAIRAAMAESVGWPWALNSAFQFSLPDRNNIRYNLDLEPMGAVGDVGWYTMRAIAEYLSPDLSIRDLSGFLRRDSQTGAAIGGGGIILFDDGSTSSWNCGFDCGAVMNDLRLSGENGVITLDDFPANSADNSGRYLHYRGGFGTTNAETVRIPSEYSSREWMFEDFAVMTTDVDLQARSISDTVRTQALLDAIWDNALQNERSA